MLTLQDLAEIETGFDFRSRIQDDPGGYYRVIQAKDIREDHTLDSDALSSVAVPARARIESKLVQLDDILLMTRGERAYATHVDVELAPTVAQSTFAILRVRDTSTLLPGFLALLLNHEPVQHRLGRLQKGTSIAYIRFEDLRQLSVPSPPPLDRQTAILALHHTHRRESALHRSLEEARERLLGSLLNS